MNLAKTLHCIFCLVKCSKYLYYIKKALCCVTLLIALAAGVSLLRDSNGELKKAARKLKAVM